MENCVVVGKANNGTTFMTNKYHKDLQSNNLPHNVLVINYGFFFPTKAKKSN